MRAVPVNINFRYTAGELEYLYSNSDSKLIVIDTEFCPVAQTVLGNLPELRSVLVVGEVPGYPVIGETVAGFGITVR